MAGAPLRGGNDCCSEAKAEDVRYYLNLQDVVGPAADQLLAPPLACLSADFGVPSFFLGLPLARINMWLGGGKAAAAAAGGKSRSALHVDDYGVRVKGGGGTSLGFGGGAWLWVWRGLRWCLRLRLARLGLRARRCRLGRRDGFVHMVRVHHREENHIPRNGQLRKATGVPAVFVRDALRKRALPVNQRLAAVLDSPVERRRAVAVETPRSERIPATAEQQLPIGRKIVCMYTCLCVCEREKLQMK